MNCILVVDDHPEIRRLLKVSLGKSFNVVEAENGEKALTAVRMYRPDLLLLDVMMPGEIDGLQVLKQVRSMPNTRNMLVGMISARGQLSDTEEAKRLGADAYFAKPFSPMQVVAWVTEQFRETRR